MPLPRAFSAFFNTVADALFPIHPAEREALAMHENDLFKLLPRATDAPIPEACSIFHYKDERVFHLVWSIKYKKSLKGAALAAHALFRVLRSFQSVMPENMRILIIPMPITKARRRERGFNQCELIADAIERLDPEKRFLFAHDLLIRVRHTSRQTLKDRRERLKSIQDTFAVNEKALPSRSDLEGYFVVVIDDVITTGSTIRDAVGTLRRAGFKNAYGLSLAH
jgi:ComF family protein